MENKEIDKLKELVKDIRIAMLTTIEEDGTLRSRPMSTNEFEGDSTLWFFTEGNSAKIHEIDHERKVNISYQDTSKEIYVSVSGDARIVQDRAKIKQLWNPLLKAWFPKGEDDPNIALLRVEISQAEYWDTPGNKMVQLFGFAKAVLTGEQYEPGENKKLNF